VTGAIAPAVPAGTDAYAGWLDRMQRGRGRHSAITRNLGSIANYRNWADRMKGSFADETKEVVPPAAGPTRR